MANSYYSGVAMQKWKSGDGPKLKAGKKAPTGGVKETAKNWPDPGPHWGTSLNRRAKFPVIKTGIVRKGVD